MSLTPTTSRAARALLGWGVRDVEAAGGPSFATVNRFETGSRPVAPAAVARLQAAYEAAGVKIFGGEAPGVRMWSHPVGGGQS